MDSFFHRGFPLVGGWILAALLLFTAAPARAAAPPEPARGASAVALFAEGSLKSFFTGGSARDRIVQMCVLCMAAALFILMKKFAPHATGPRQHGLTKRPTEVVPDANGEDASRFPTQDSSGKV
jgi:peptidoglycan/LPS O-acetylase OafA/YrhL